MKDQVDLAILPWVAQAVGNKLLSYLLGCDVDSLPSLTSGECKLTHAQVEVVSVFNAFRRSIPAELDEASSKEVLRAWLTQVTPVGRSVASSFHEHTSGPPELPAPRDDIDAALARLAVDAYPAFLLPPEPDPLPMMDEVNRLAFSLLIRHPQAATFAEAALQDAVLQRIFATEEPHAGRVAVVYRNTGSGGGLQLAMLPEMLLRAAWRHVGGDERSPEAFAEKALAQLGLVRDVLAGRPRTIPAKLAFTGILLPPGTRLELPDGTVRPVSDDDHGLVPETLKGKVGTTDGAGNSITINYDGDVVLDCEFPYKVSVRDTGTEPPSIWPEEVHSPASFEHALRRLRFSLMLAVDREPRPQLIPTWRYFDEPLSHGMSISWNDPRQATGLTPAQLTEVEITSWRQWYERLDAPPIRKIDLAIGRILRASSERREPSDVLIDSVIAWEHLFGTKEGEPTFRVSTCLAVLLEDSFDARTVLRKRLSDIYSLRSKVVHGSGALKDADYLKCQEALRVAIRAVRVLVSDRPDILALRDGAARSAALLLGG